MHGRGHLVGIKAHGKGLMLSILRYGNEVRAAEHYFERLTMKPDNEAVSLASELIKRMSGRFEPEKMPDEYARAIHELVKAKVEHRAPLLLDNIAEVLAALEDGEGEREAKPVHRH